MTRTTALTITFLTLVSLVVTGCGPQKTADKANDKKADAAKPDDGTGIFNKFTQEIVEYDPAIHKVMVNEKDDINIVTGALGAYGPVTEKLAGINMSRHMELFRAEHGRYPKDHKEFMSKIVKLNGFKLPMLRTNRQYAYDAENHALVIVEKEKE